MLKLAVCVSGGGTNLQAIIDRIEDGTIQGARIVRVISNNPRAYALERARQAGIEGICVSPRQYETRDLFNQALLEALQAAEPDLIVLARSSRLSGAGSSIYTRPLFLLSAERGIMDLRSMKGPWKEASRFQAPRSTLWTRGWIPVPSFCRRRWRSWTGIQPRSCRRGSWNRRNGSFCRGQSP